MTTKKTVISNPTMGLQGYLHDIEFEKDSVLVFQLPRVTNQLSQSYIEGATRTIRDVLPDGKKAIIIGCDVNIYEIPGMDASVLLLKGLI